MAKQKRKTPHQTQNKKAGQPSAPPPSATQTQLTISECLSKAQSLLSTKSILSLLELGTLWFFTHFTSPQSTATLAEKVQLLQSLISAAKLVSVEEENELTPLLIEKMELWNRVTPETDGPLVASLRSVLLYELFENTEDLYAAEDEIANAYSRRKVGEMDEYSESVMKQLLLDIPTAVVLLEVNIDEALEFMHQKKYRELRDHVMLKLKSIHRGLSYERDAYVRLFLASCREGDPSDIRIVDEEFIIAFARDEKEHLVHRAMAAFSAYIISVHLGKPVPRRLYTAMLWLRQHHPIDSEQKVWCLEKVMVLGTAIYAPGGLMHILDNYNGLDTGVQPVSRCEWIYWKGKEGYGNAVGVGYTITAHESVNLSIGRLSIE
ncbi:hypothetical protein HDU79_003191 [Rhizoclosmatium sp. JEL0117]|nr:hypothetical protein HDU79_003191 [Rhizoclosmatium sp. JEL0117]